uniref:C2H2-type domain-containing protein n=1 Tax=Meloidogyne javanica TaxID=6303 RepID=A0A915LZS5_MELJA
MRDAIIFAITYSTDLCSTIKMPYFLTLTQNELQELAANGGEQGNDVVNNGGGGAGSSCNIRGRTRNITSETFMCLNKVRPTPNEHRDNCSAYSFWTPSEFSNGESQLIQLLLCATNSFSAPWQKRICPLGSHYTLAANKESIQLRTTHSSFWGQQQQQKIAQQQTNNTIFNPQRQHCDDLMIERAGGLIKNIPKNEDMEELYQLENSQIIKMETDDKENGSSQQSAPFLPSKMDEEEINTKIITTTDNSIKLLKLPPNATSKGVGGFGGGKYSFNKTKTNVNEEVPISTTQAMVQVYIRGRGRGRYVCERCGIRCKKPSMLKKHLRSHTNVRPFTCMTCNFSFKTKGNLTKHLVSKTHKRRMLDSNNEETMQGINTTKSLLERNYGNEEEGEEGGRLVNILVERETHTPPTLWTRTDCFGTLAAATGGYTDVSGDEEPEPLDMGWPPQDSERICQSAPPSALLSPGGRSRTKRKKKGKINNSQANDASSVWKLKTHTLSCV